MSSGIYNQYTGYRNRRSTRLIGYDYSRTGYYFVTICIQDRMKRLLCDVPSSGHISNSVGAGSKPAFLLNQYGNIVQFTWNDLMNHITGIVLDEFVIMPNHVHGIIQITGAGKERAGLEPAPTGTMAEQIALPEIIRQFKTFSAKRINMARNSPGISVWQRNYYEHIIRDEKSLFFIRNYIRENPLNWDSDFENHIDREINEFEMTEIGGEFLKTVLKKKVVSR